MNPSTKSGKMGVTIGTCVVGAAAGFAFMLLCNGIVAWLVIAEYLEESSAGYITLAVLLASAMIGGFSSIRRAPEGKLLASMITGGVYLALLVLLKLACFPGAWGGVGVTVGVVMGSSVATALLMSGQGRRSHKKRK